MNLPDFDKISDDSKEFGRTRFGSQEPEVRHCDEDCWQTGHCTGACSNEHANCCTSGEGCPLD